MPHSSDCIAPGGFAQVEIGHDYSFAPVVGQRQHPFVRSDDLRVPGGPFSVTLESY